MTANSVKLQMLIAACTLIPLVPVSVAQDLSLFEPVEQVESAPRPDTRRQQAPGTSEPDFTLVGTSRIGDRVSATLLSRNGQTVVVRGNGNPIPGFAGYQVSSIEPRQVSITYPAGASCVEAPDQGVNCQGNVAALSLTTAAAIPVEQPQSRGNGEQAAAEQPAGEVAQDAPSDNPFAAALRAAAAEAEATPGDAADRRAEAQRFQVRRIRPEDVPEGMRVVRTPFGDRLIQE